MSKAFAKLAERFAEMTGDKDVTAISETFEQNAKGVDAVEQATKELLGSFQALLQPNPSARAKFSGPSGVASRLTGGSTPNKFPQTEAVLAACMEKHSGSMESFIDNSTFALTLKDSSETFRRLSEAREDLDYSVKQNVFEPWQTLQSTQIKEVKDQRVKMEGRRLYYDNLRKKYTRNPEKVNQMDVEQAKSKLEETLRQTDASMDAILCSDIDRVAQLKHLIDAQKEYHEKATSLLTELSSTLNRRINEAQPRNSTKPSATLKPPPQTMGNAGWGVGDTNGFSSNIQYQPPTSSQSFNATPSNTSVATSNFDPWGDSGGVSGNNAGAQYALPPANDNNPFDLVDLNSAVSVATPASTNQTRRVKALYDFERENPGELELKVGDVITNVKDMDDNWFEGEISKGGQTRSGHFPKTFVQELF